MNHEDVYRTDPATQGLLNIVVRFQLLWSTCFGFKTFQSFRLPFFNAPLFIYIHPSILRYAICNRLIQDNFKVRYNYLYSLE